MVLAIVTSALALLAPSATGAEVTNITNDLGGYAQPFPSENYPFELYTQVTHSQGDTYVVMVDDLGHPKVTRITEHPNSTATHLTVNLDEPDYRPSNDPHNGFSIGIDTDGYLHVAGDMHNFGFSDGRQGVPNPEDPYGSTTMKYPLRYQFNYTSIPEGERATVLYWVSNKPRDISAGFRFAGYGNDPQRIPGSGWSYGRFFNDLNGKLYYSSRGRAVGRSTGAYGLTLNAYDTTTRTWSSRGATPPPGTYTLPPDPYGPSYPVLYWAEAGEPPTQNKVGNKRSYQVYQAGFNFDHNNRLHLVVSGYVDLYGTSRVLHASSDDGGISWKQSDGTPITSLPLRGDVDAAAAGGMTDVYTLPAPTLVLDEKGDSDPYNDTWVSGTPNPTIITKVFADTAGNLFALHGAAHLNWRTWDNTLGAWKASSIKGLAGNITPDGTLTTWADYGIWRNGSTTSSMPHVTGVISPSQLGIQQTGKIYGLYTETIGGIAYAKVRKVTFTPASGVPGTGFFQQSWMGLPGRHFGALNGTVYPLSPTTADVSPNDPAASLFIQHTTSQSTVDGKIGTANRVRGYFIPPSTGNYVFKVWGKFSAKLFVSTDESPLNRGTAKVLFDDNLALHTASPILPGQWSRASVSAPVSLVANKRYFVELVHKGASGNPHVEVGASGPGGFEQLPLLAARFDAWLPAAPQIHKGIEAANLTSTQATLSVLGYDDYEESALKYAWSATGPGTVSFSAQNTNAAKTCTATFSATGTYVLTATVTDEDGLSVTSTREIVVD
ncbi:MAG: BNR-4 repeat-containing protein [Verrucomicrobiota bacterium]